MRKQGFAKNKENETMKRIRWQCILLGFLLSYISGCGAFSAVPLTLKEVKDYVAGTERSLGYGLDRTLTATVFVLKKDGFDLRRIEYFNHKGLVQAAWEGTSVEISFERMTPKMSRMTSRVKSKTLFREYTCEDALSEEIEGVLHSSKPLNWVELTHGMTRVHVSPDKKSPVMAYLKPGLTVDLVEEQGQWGKILLMDRGAGFIALNQLKVDAQ